MNFSKSGFFSLKFSQNDFSGSTGIIGLGIGFGSIGFDSIGLGELSILDDNAIFSNCSSAIFS